MFPAEPDRKEGKQMKDPKETKPNRPAKRAIIGIATCLTLILAVLFIHKFSYDAIADKRVIVKPLKPLASLPEFIGDWVDFGDEEPMEQKLITYLGLTDYVWRDYGKEGEDTYLVNLYIGFHGKQVQGKNIHSPKVCLPSSGWKTVHHKKIKLAGESGDEFSVNYMLVTRGEYKMVSLFWYQSRGIRYSNEYIGKWYRTLDTAKQMRTDGSLIRLLYTIPKDESAEEALRQLKGFAQDLLPLLDEFLPGKTISKQNLLKEVTRES